MVWDAKVPSNKRTGLPRFGTGLTLQEVDDLTKASMLSSNSDSASAPEDFAGKTQQEEGAKYT